MPHETLNITLARRFYDYLNNRADEDWSAIFAKDWSAVPPLPQTPDQIAGYKMVIDQFRAGAPDLNVDNVEIIANDDVVAVRSRVSGTHAGELFGQSASGKPFSFTAMDVHRVIDGKIVGTWHVEDFAGMMGQLS
jgi:predicted ester cyclase